MTSHPAAPTTPPELRSRLLAGYRPHGRFDEAVAPDGSIRPPYTRFLRDLERLPARELRRRWDTARRFVHEQGITYHVYGDAAGVERPWRLDPVPLLLSAAEWRTLESALVQRAVLLNRLLADCYGPQQLMREGRLPPGLVFGPPDFLRPCHGIRPPRDLHLALYAADLARAPDGSWWVVSDRTQIPTGAGYALANRLVTSRVMPDAFRHCHVQRLAGFFREIQQTLAQLAAHRTDNPRIVLLTPGSYNETYFEQAYLARYLGLSLVEGQDLTVRHDRVFLKTLSGLEPVDVILRRVDDDFCDPLELRNDSMLGVPGLIEAWRSGHVAIANAPGSGLVQNPAFMAFLPGLCRHLLGEELKLPSAATWWCGQTSAAKYVLDHLDELYVKPAWRTRNPGKLRGRVSTPEAAAALRERIAFQPHAFVAQEWVDLASAPASHQDRLEARPVGLRVYLVASGDSYKVMAGGLARVAADESARLIAMQQGGMSKDVWVLADGPVADDSLLASSRETIELRRGGNNLPSRMADNFFWLGRYIERADATCRLLRSALVRFSEEFGGSTSPALGPILGTLARQGQLDTPAARTVEPDEAVLHEQIHACIFDPARRGSLRQIADEMLRLTNVVRDRTSHDFWGAISQFHDRLVHRPVFSGTLSGEAAAFVNQLILLLASCHGLARENMTRAQGWRFLDMGHRLERAVYLCTFLDCALASPDADDASVLEAVLEVVDNSITYRSRYNVVPHPAAVYDLVLLDDANPRSLIYQLRRLLEHFERLPGDPRSAVLSPAQRALIDALAQLQLADPSELGRSRRDGAGTRLARTIRNIARAAPEISDAIAVAWFAHSAYPRSGRTSARG